MYRFYSRGNTSVGKIWFVVLVFCIALVMIGWQTKDTLQEIEAHTHTLQEAL